MARTRQAESTLERREADMGGTSVAESAGESSVREGIRMTKARSMAQRRKGGRPRKLDAERKPCGQLVYEQVGPTIPAETTMQRAQYGCGNPGDQAFGSALGKMLSMEIISRQQHETGQHLFTVWTRWARLADCPSRHARAVDPGRAGGGRNHGHDDAEQWQRVKAQLDESRDAVWRACAPGRLAWSLIETAVADDMIPPRMDPKHPCYSPEWTVGPAALRDALDVLGYVLGLVRRR